MKKAPGMGQLSVIRCVCQIATDEGVMINDRGNLISRLPSILYCKFCGVYIEGVE